MTGSSRSNGMRAAIIFLLSGLSGGYLGCTALGPEPVEPKAEWLASWKPTLYGELQKPEAGKAVDLRFWWKLFNDPVLNSLIEAAKAENLDLRVAGLRILESRATLGIATSGRYPQLQETTGSIAFVNTQEFGGAAPDSDQSLVSYNAGFNLGWELDFWGRFQRGIESAEAAYFSSLYTYHDLQVLLSAQVAELYFAYLTTRQRIEIARANAAIQERSFEITRQLYQSGQSNELDFQQAKTQYQSTLASIPELEIALYEIRNALCVLLGRSPGQVPELYADTGPLPEVDLQQFADIPGSLLLRRPDIRASLWRVAVQSAQIGIAEAELYPSISLAGTIGWSGNSVGASPETIQLLAGPSFSWNVFDYGRIKNNVRVQDARLQQAIENYRNGLLLAAAEVDDAGVALVKTKEQAEPLRESLNAAERSLELATKRYQEGYADFQRVLDSQRAVATRMEQELQNRSSQLSAVVQLYKAIGGGWTEASKDLLLPETTRETMRNRSDWGSLLEEPMLELTVE